MKSINKNEINLYEINKSKFYAFLFYIDNTDEINSIIDNIKHEYKDATHYCYAYICDNVKRFNDDGEPSGTAGMPILNVLENHGLNHVLALVVRYFGGIKLGAGGLVRAYTNSVCEVLDKVDIVDLIEGIKVEIEFSYENVKQVDYLLKDYKIVNKEYSDNIVYTIDIDKNINIKDILDKYIISYKEICSIYIK